MSKRPFLLGLTGSIGMGKSTAAAMFRRLGAPVYDADAAVHRAYARGGIAVAPIAAAFPDAVKNGAVDRQALGAIVLADPAQLRRLEAIVHPLLIHERRRFLRRAQQRRAPVAVLDIPLLFEKGGGMKLDAVAVVSAPAFVQRARVLARPNMNAEKLAAILRRQMPDAEKRRRADFIIHTGLGKGETLRHIRKILRKTGRKDA